MLITVWPAMPIRRERKYQMAPKKIIGSTQAHSNVESNPGRTPLNSTWAASNWSTS